MFIVYQRNWKHVLFHEIKVSFVSYGKWYIISKWYIIYPNDISFIPKISNDLSYLKWYMKRLLRTPWTLGIRIHWWPFSLGETRNKEATCTWGSLGLADWTSIRILSDKTFFWMTMIQIDFQKIHFFGWLRFRLTFKRFTFLND